MFERNNINNHIAATCKPIPVEIALDNNTSLRGRVFCTTSRGLAGELEQGSGFLKFEPYNGVTQFVAKSTIRTLVPVSMPKADQLDRQSKAADRSEPHAILGIDKETSPHNISAAYRKMAKAYHPDRFSGIELPTEVTEYLSAMAMRVNAAHAQLRQTSSQQAI